MQYILQQHPMGCMIAAIAMILDMSYEEVAKTIPLPDIQALTLTGRNSLGLKTFDDMKVLAETRGQRVFDFDSKRETLEPGFRYLGMLTTPDPLVKHVVAIDEQGVVFDPDPGKEQSRENWKAYDFVAVLEFQAL
jgi:hypothetical protein